MKEKIRRVLLIDDSKNDNFFHNRVLRKHDFAEEVVIKDKAADALAYLSTMIQGQYPQPDLILLDINMPGMDGWEFIESYRELSEAQQGKIVLLMLSVSLNPSDSDRAKLEPLINGFVNKPISAKSLEKITNDYF